MQTYNAQGEIIKGKQQGVRVYVGNLQANEDTLRSSFSGTAFPDSPVEGQHCYRTDKELEYIYKSGGWVVNDDGTPTNIEVIKARGSLADVATRLSVALNDDGTLKNPNEAEIDEWKDNALVVTYVSATSFTVPKDLTPIFTASRKIKAILGTTSVITSVAASSYDSTNTKTTVTVNDAVLTSELSAVKYSIVQYGVPSNCDEVALNTHNNSMMAHNGILRLAQRSTTYAVGDIAFSSSLPSWARLECVTAGTTAATAPNVSAITRAGVLLADGGVTWIVDDIRDSHRVGEVVSSLYLPPGYVKANGATVNRTDYPRLVALATKYSLWTSDSASNLGLFGVGDGSTTMALPNWTGRMAQFAASAGGTVAAGLPNIYGTIGRLWNEHWALPRTVGYSGVFSMGPTVDNIGYPSSAVEGRATTPTTDVFNAATYNAIYGNSTTVQPPAINVIPCMKY